MVKNNIKMLGNFMEGNSPDFQSFNEINYQLLDLMDARGLPDEQYRILYDRTYDLYIWAKDINYDIDGSTSATDEELWEFEREKSFRASAVNALSEGGDVDIYNEYIYNPIIAQNYKASMSEEEKSIFDGLLIGHQEGYLRAATQAYIYSEINFPQPVRNRKGDAVKHTLWNALSTIYIGEALTEQLTTAHENITYDSEYPNHYKESQMDLFNNTQGRQIANEAGFFGNIRGLIEQALIDGRLRYLNNLEYTGIFWKATNTSQLIPTNE